LIVERETPTLQGKASDCSAWPVRNFFWVLGLSLAASQAWVFRYQNTADAICYLDVSDGALPGGDWHRLINGVWSPLYPLCLGVLRRVFVISRSHEIVAAHLFNIVFFVFAFVCFEIFLKQFFSIVQNVAAPARDQVVALPMWVYRSLVYSLFLWASLSAIAIRTLRPDTLMSGFLYLAMALLLSVRGKPARWRDYLLLGLILGIGGLAKAPMLPISVLILAISVFLVESWRPALRMAATAFGVVLLVEGFYFVPLSLARGHFTLGESGTYNYLMHVDRAGPAWYFQDPGLGKGTFVHPPTKLFDSPPVYAFGIKPLVTHPLRFDPSEWIDGARPRFVVRRQIGEAIANFRQLALTFEPLLPLIGILLALCFQPTQRNQVLAGLRRTWPLCVVGIAGCAMYVPIHLEPRYVGAFLLLFCCGLLNAPLQIPRALGRPLVYVIIVIIAVVLVLPLAEQAHRRYFQIGQGPDQDSLAAAALESMGVRPRDRVARISLSGLDLGIERIARVEVISEVDLTHAGEFWTSPLETQHTILNIFAAQGVKAVIATEPRLSDANRSDWKQLGTSRYWVWLTFNSNVTFGS
jgi:hypothetical protein